MSGPQQTSPEWKVNQPFFNEQVLGSESEIRPIGKPGSLGNDMLDFNTPGRGRIEVPNSTPGKKVPWLLPEDTPPGRIISLKDKYNPVSRHQVRPSLDLPTDKLAQEDAPIEGRPYRKPGPGMQAQAPWHPPAGRPAQGVNLDGRPKLSHSTEMESQPGSRNQKPGDPNAPTARLPATLNPSSKASPQVPDSILGPAPDPIPRLGGPDLPTNALPIAGQHLDRHGPEIPGDENDRVGRRPKPIPDPRTENPWTLADRTGGEKMPQNTNQPAKLHPATTPGVTTNHGPGEKPSEKDQEEWDVFVHPATGKKIYTGGGASLRGRRATRPRGGPPADTLTRGGRDMQQKGEASTEKAATWRRSERESRNRRRSRSRGELLE